MKINLYGELYWDGERYRVGKTISYDYEGDVCELKPKQPKAPKAPDYTGAAMTQGHINNPTINGIGGSQTVTWNGNDPTITQSLSPEQQTLYDQSNQQKEGISEIGVNSLPWLQDFYSQGFNDDGKLDRQRVEDASYNQATSRLNPQWQRSDDQLENKLANQGIPVGSDAWKEAMQNQEFAENDAYSSARNYATTQGASSQQQALANALQMRQQPLQEQSQLMNLSQGQMPQFQGYTPTDYTGAVNAQGNYNTDVYNAKSAAAGNTQSGLFGLAGKALPFLF